jgi:hypothetical protein
MSKQVRMHNLRVDLVQSGHFLNRSGPLKAAPVDLSFLRFHVEVRSSLGERSLRFSLNFTPLPVKTRSQPTYRMST